MRGLPLIKWKLLQSVNSCLQDDFVCIGSVLILMALVPVHVVVLHASRSAVLCA